MIKRAGFAILGLLALSLPLVAQDRNGPLPDGADTIAADELRSTGEIDAGPALALDRPDVFSNVDGTILIHSLPVLTLLDGRRFPISGELGRMGMAPLDLFPLAFLNAITVQKHASPMQGVDAPGGVVDLRLNRDYGTHGEVGVFYGKSSGRYGREDFQAYMIGGVGNDKIQITAGAAYEESSGRIARPRR